MPIEPEKALAATFDGMDFTFDTRDVMLYALGVGAGAEEPTEKSELQFTYENGGLKTLPTFGVIPAFPSLTAAMGAPGMSFNPMMLLHGEQELEILGDIPTSGTLKTVPNIAAIYDKGKGALVYLEALTTDEKGNEIFKNTFGIFLRGEGGFGGDSGPKAVDEKPDRDPDTVHEDATTPNQALIYRLSGDRNPLHADPNFAKMGGFDKPILHGLCTFGYVGRAVLKHYCDNDPTKFKSIKVRFASSVYPGETIVTSMWKDGNTIHLEAATKERGEAVITNAKVVVAD